MPNLINQNNLELSKDQIAGRLSRLAAAVPSLYLYPKVISSEIEEMQPHVFIDFFKTSLSATHSPLLPLKYLNALNKITYELSHAILEVCAELVKIKPNYGIAEVKLEAAIQKTRIYLKNSIDPNDSSNKVKVFLMWLTQNQKRIHQLTEPKAR
jgi:hypothetical protein